MIIKLPYDIIHLKSGLVAVMVGEGSELYSDVLNENRTNSNTYIIASLPSIFVNATAEIMFLIAFYNLLKKRKKKLTIFLFICFAILPLGSIANGQRGGAFEVLITVSGTYFLFAPILEPKLRKVVTKIGFVVLILFLIPIILLTNSRFGDRIGSSEQSVYSYMGQQNLNFDIYAFDNNGIRYGDRVFPLFKKMLGYENVPNDYFERRNKYSNLKINDEVFIGYVGDILLDFGPVVSSLLFLLFTSIAIFLTKTNNSTYYFYQLLIIQLVLVLGLQGGLKLYPFADARGLKLITFLLLYVSLRIKITKNILNTKNKQLKELKTYE